MKQISSKQKTSTQIMESSSHIINTLKNINIISIKDLDELKISRFLCFSKPIICSAN